MRDSEARKYVRTLVFAALLGVPVAFAAVLFQTAIHDVIHLVWDVIPEELGWNEPAWWYVILVPGLAGLLVAAAVRLPGHGGHSPLEGLGADPIPPIALASILPAALATLGLGLVLGPEGPLIALGLGLGALAVRLIRLEGTGAQLLVLAGAFAAVAALFGGPLIAAFLLFEVTAAGGKIPAQQIGRALLPGFVAAGTGALATRGSPDGSGLHQMNLALPSLPPYESVRLTDVAWCLLIAAVVSVLIVAIRHLAHGSRRSPPSALKHCCRCRARRRRAGSPLSSTADRPVDLVFFLGQAELPAVDRRGIGGRADPPRRDQGSRLRAVARRRVPRWTGVPCDCARRRRRDRRRRRAPWAAHDTGGCSRHRRWDDGGSCEFPSPPYCSVSLHWGPSAFDVAPIAVLAAAVGWLVATVLPNPEDRVPEEVSKPCPPYPRRCALGALSRRRPVFERYFGSASSL